MDNYFVGQLQLFALGYPPMGWVPCDGRLLQIAAYPALFALIGTIYGGDGRTTFGVPNLKQANLISSANPSYVNFSNWYIATNGIFPQQA